MSDAEVRITEYGRAGYFIEAPGRSSGELRALQSYLARTLPRADVVLGGSTLAVLDVEPSPELENELRQALALRHEPAAPGPLHEIGVVYDGIDLDEVSRLTRLPRDEVMRLHASTEYEVEVQGFLPGFAYLSGLPSELRLPRLSTPRPRVAAGSVAIAERFAGIYPFDSPGGWHLLGRAVEPRLFDPRATQPMRLRAGDRVRFIETQAAAAPVPPRIRERSAPEPGRAHLVVERVTGALTVQDSGRLGQRGAGIPPSGALDPQLFQLTNAALGNALDAAALELWLGGAMLRARGALWVALDGAPRHLTDGETLTLEPGERAVRYLAVEGGIRVPEVLGSRSTLLVARLGGVDGRALRPGDRLPVGDPGDAASNSLGFLGGAQPPASAAPLPAPAPHAPALAGAPVLVVPGPHTARLGARFEQLLAGEFVVSPLTDRVGMRLERGLVDGAAFELGRPAPVVRGAVQLTPDGTLVIFGPDHPVTGGYPQIAVVLAESFSSLAARRPGARVRFLTRGEP